jgi:membrane protease YdiL (CAAX protease family)
MSLLLRTTQVQLAALRRNGWLAAIVLITCIVVVAYGAQNHRLPKAIAYVVAMGVGAFLVDLFVQWRASKPAFPVRQPVREAWYVVGFILIGYVALFTRFVLLDWEALPGLVRVAILPLFAFAFPVAITLVMLWLKYKPRELGFRIGPWAWMAIPILVLTAGTAFLVAREELTIGRVLGEGGWFGLLVTGFLSAGLPEEFSRMLLQTRVGAVLKNPGVGWFIATVLWAFLHAPKWIGEGDVYDAVMGSIRIIPLGLLWGYMTHRTQSILPATFVHGLNVWGLQNF